MDGAEIVVGVVGLPHVRGIMHALQQDPSGHRLDSMFSQLPEYAQEQLAPTWFADANLVQRAAIAQAELDLERELDAQQAAGANGKALADTISEQHANGARGQDDEMDQAQEQALLPASAESGLQDQPQAQQQDAVVAASGTATSTGSGRRKGRSKTSKQRRNKKKQSTV